MAKKVFQYRSQGRKQFARNHEDGDADVVKPVEVSSAGSPDRRLRGPVQARAVVRDAEVQRQTDPKRPHWQADLRPNRSRLFLMDHPRPLFRFV